MAAVETYPERYANPTDFAREVNLPLLGSARVRPVPAGAGLAQLLDISSGAEVLGPVVDSLNETRRSLTLRSLLVAGFPHDPECFATALCLAREWSRRGLRVAVIDLDFWNPTVSRPPSHPNEGLVDVLEYGCSFGRVAWEIVADKLWLIGPGSHPPEESRIAEHPDWVRAGRVFASCVDVAIYSAPLLDRRGFTGKLSKKMDAVILAAATERIGRADLRDAFLELWASDAPMIGCVGIEPADAPAARRVEAASAPSVGAPALAPAAVSPALAPAEPPAWEREASAALYAAEVARAAAPAPAAPAARATRVEDRGAERDLEAALERDVRRGIVEKKPTARRGNLGILVGAVLGLALVAGGLSALLSRRPAPPRGSVQANQPAGEEPVTPATDEGGNLDDPSAMVGAPATPGSGQIGSVTAMGKEFQSAETPGTGTSAPPQAAAPATPPASSPPVASRPPAREALRAGLGGTGAGSLPGLGSGAADAAKPFRVHVASFRTETKVKEIVAALRAKKLDAWFDPPPPGGAWYRVFVGRFATEAEAATYAQWLLKTGAVDRAESYPQTKR
ncbi:MAG TPA: SPOR domain-containing protein [Candidatus Binatia bacterium]|nr:SPOR domain-containing protein [Candidatus Binatia bacterium]